MQNRTELIKITSLKKGNSATLYYSVPKKTTPSNKPNTHVSRLVGSIGFIFLGRRVMFVICCVICSKKIFTRLPLHRQLFSEYIVLLGMANLERPKPSKLLAHIIF